MGGRGQGQVLRARIPGPLPSSLWKLDLCTTVLPQIEKLLQSKYERYSWGSHTCLTAGRGGGGPRERPPGLVHLWSGCTTLLSPPKLEGQSDHKSMLPLAPSLPRFVSVSSALCLVILSIPLPLQLCPDRLHLPEADPAAVSAPHHRHPGGPAFSGCGHQPGGEVRNPGCWGGVVCLCVCVCARAMSGKSTQACLLMALVKQPVGVVTVPGTVAQGTRWGYQSLGSSMAWPWPGPCSLGLAFPWEEGWCG